VHNSGITKGNVEKPIPEPRMVVEQKSKAEEKSSPGKKEPPKSKGGGSKRATTASANPARDAQPTTTGTNSPSVGTINQGPCGVVQVGGQENKATGGTCAPPPPTVRWRTEVDPVPGQIIIHFTVDRSVEIPMFTALCDKACTTVDVSIVGVQSVANGDQEISPHFLTFIRFDVPRPLGAGIDVTWRIKSKTGGPINIKEMHLVSDPKAISMRQ
jgi:hypothetical protein